MSRVKLKISDEKQLFTAIINVRIGDINYGGHVGNDSILSIMHEARVQLLQNFGFSEFNAGGNSLIMADVMIAYKGEAFYGDVLHIRMYAEEITTKSFDLVYFIYTYRHGIKTEIAHAKTGMVCFDYDTRSIVAMKDELRHCLLSGN